MSNHLLDQVSSHAMSRVAAARGIELVVTPAGEEAVPPPRRSWTRWLPYVFFLLSLVALGGMLLGAANLADDGWSVSDAVQLALMALLVGGVVQQARMMVRATPAGRWLTRSRAKQSPSASGLAAPVHLLDMVRAEDLAAVRPAVAPAARLHQQARRKGGDLSGRAAVLVVVALSFLAFLGMCFVCGYVAWVAGPWDPGLWLTLPFTALTGFGAWQVFSSARRSAFRGRPWTLLSRAFRDSVRVWGSGSLAMHVLVTATATASLTGAALAPVVQGVPAPFDLFVVDSASGAAFRVDIDTLTGVQLTDTPERLRFAGLGATAANVTLANGVKLPRGSVVGVVESQAGVQGLVAFRPGSREPLQGPRITPALPGASFAGGTGGMFALQPDGALSRVDHATGAATRIGQTTSPFGPMTFDGAAGQLVVFSEGAVWRVDAASGAVVSSVVVQPAVQACGIARAGKDVFFVAEAGTGRLLLVNTKDGTAREVIVTGQFPERPCLITSARRD